MHNDPPENAIKAMILLTALAVLIVFMCETIANWLR